MCCLLLSFSFISCGAKENASSKTIMALIAHPDDEVLISPLLAKYGKEHTVYLVIATKGDQGVRDFAGIPAGDQLTKVRAKESKCSCEELGIQAPIFLNYDDGKLHDWENVFSLDEAVEKLFKKYRPDAVLTFGPDGAYGHPDHRMVSDIVTEVFMEKKPTETAQLFYFAYPPSVIESMDDFKTPMGSFFKSETKATSLEFLSYQIPFNEEELLAGRKSFGCHESQFTPDEMDDIYQLLSKANSTVYLRPWFGANGIKTDLFD